MNTLLAWQPVRWVGGVLGVALCFVAVAASADEQIKPRPAIGVTLSQSSRSGVRVVTVALNSPADDSDIKPGDQILAINHEPVTQIADVIRLIGNGKIGNRTGVTIRRGSLEGTVYPKLRDESEVFTSQPGSVFDLIIDTPPSPRSDAEGMPYVS